MRPWATIAFTTSPDALTWRETIYKSVTRKTSILASAAVNVYLLPPRPKSRTTSAENTVSTVSIVSALQQWASDWGWGIRNGLAHVAIML